MHVCECVCVCVGGGGEMCLCVYTYITLSPIIQSTIHGLYIIHCIDVYMHDCRTIIIIQVLAAGFFLGYIYSYVTVTA